GYGVSIETYLALGQWTMDAHTLGHFSQGNGYGNASYSAFQVFRCVHSHNTGILTGSISVNTVNTSMAIGAAQNRHMEHAIEFDIINIGRLTGNQAGVFTPFNRRTEHSSNTHVCLSFLIARNSN